MVDWEVIKLLSAVHERVTGRVPPSIASTATTDARAFVVEAGGLTLLCGSSNFDNLLFSQVYPLRVMDLKLNVFMVLTRM